ncbi:Uncharacterised protein [Brucella neotomae]|nr:Uncharacterised protein [Brucella neotomae]
MQIVGITCFDLHRHNIAHAQRAARADMNAAINFRRVVAGAALANGAVGFIDDDRQTLANLLFQEVG